MLHRLFQLTILLSLIAFLSVPAFAQPGRGPGGRGGETSSVRLDPEQLDIKDGVAKIPDMETFEELSYKGQEVMIDTHLADQQFVKFQIERVGSDEPQMYYINTRNHRAHPMFMRFAGIEMQRGRGDGTSMRGVLIYHPNRKAPSGELGLFTFEYEPNDAYPFDRIRMSNDFLIKTMPILKGRLAYFPMPRAIEQYEKDKPLYEESDVVVYLEKDIKTNFGYLALNKAESFGRLQIMNPNTLPGARDIVLCKSLPNEMPRVAGVISAVRQTPLSHVNLRAVQDKIPNSYIVNAAADEKINSLIGKFVYYKVNQEGYELREARQDEVDAHFDSIRPRSEQKPIRDLSVKEVRPLKRLDFADSKSVGVKAANLATMHQFGFPEGTIPEGHAIPFYFYDEFMKHNGFYDAAKKMIKSPDFQKSVARKEAALKAFRKQIKDGEMPQWMMQALDEVHKSFPEGQSVRCRSSTNNEDLPGFSGAGLYDSYTHHPDEGHFSKSVKQVFASLWNYRAFEEREFYRVDHFSAAMGVLVHPNYSDELANGVAVTDDILYQTSGNYYLNTQVGEDLVTNPDEESIPEEILLDWTDLKKIQVMRESNRTENAEPLLRDEHFASMQKYLGKIHARFAKKYGVDLDSPNFAMEIEYKINADGKLVIKQARPWVYSVAATKSE